MRILHISDLHWRGISRHEEYTQAFTDLFEKAKQLKPDLIVNCGDTFHTKTQGITPEIIERLSWMFRNMADIAPTYTILGNHDLNVTNPNRLDIITPIHNSLNHPRAHLLRTSGVYKVSEITDKDVYLCAFSMVDKNTWSKIKPVEQVGSKEVINIALFHGSISGVELDNKWKLPHGEEEIESFSKFDFVFLGDIHKQQFLNWRTVEETITENDIEKYRALYGTDAIEVIEEV